MNKVLVELHIPTIGEHFDILAPVDVPLDGLITVLVSGVVEVSNGKYVASGSEQLCTKSPEGRMDPLLTLQDYGIQDGTQLYLV